MFFIRGEEIHKEQREKNKNSISNFTNPIVQPLHQELERRTEQVKLPYNMINTPFSIEKQTENKNKKMKLSSSQAALSCIQSHTCKKRKRNDQWHQ